MDDDFRNCIDVLEKIGEKGFRSKKLRERKEFSVCAAAAVSVTLTFSLTRYSAFNNIYT